MEWFDQKKKALSEEDLGLVSGGTSVPAEEAAQAIEPAEIVCPACGGLIPVPAGLPEGIPLICPHCGAQVPTVPAADGVTVSGGRIPGDRFFPFGTHNV